MFAVPDSCTTLSSSAAGPWPAETPVWPAKNCGALVAARTDDCRVAQETRFYPSAVLREVDEDEVDRAENSFALIADWDNEPADTRRYRWLPKPTRPRPELVTTRWSGRGVKKDLYRDDPPA